MIKQVAATRYAKAYFLHCDKTSTLKEIDIECERILKIISSNPDLQRTLNNRILANQKKKRILLNSFGNISENLSSLIEILVRKNRLYIFNDVLLQFIELYKINSGVETCYLLSAEKISNQVQEKLKPLIKRMTKNKIKIENIIDKSLIGGFIIKIGDMQFDNSINSTLNKLKTTLKKENTFI